MAQYRNALPQLDDRLFLTDGGLETTLIFHEGYELNHFAAFELMQTDRGRQSLLGYYRQHARTAVAAGIGFILDTPTWRSNADWGRKLRYSLDALDQINRSSVDLVAQVRDELSGKNTPMVISGAIGPLGDGYAAGNTSADDAQALHAHQVRSFAASDADFVTAYTMTSIDEAVGVTRAAIAAGIPIAISFTVETDGRLPAGDTLQAAIKAVDAATDGAPVYYMINCAHPTHFDQVLTSGASWVQRLRGIRANASRRSHAELDEAQDLDAGNPVELGQQYREMRRGFRHLTVLGGCCGTDHRHVEQICFACTSVEEITAPRARDRMATT